MSSSRNLALAIAVSLLAACGGSDAENATATPSSPSGAGNISPGVPSLVDDGSSPPPAMTPGATTGTTPGSAGSQPVSPPSGDTVLPPGAISPPVSERPGADDPDLPAGGTALGTVTPASFESVAHDTNGNILPTGSGILAFELVADGLTRPWGFAPLPDGRMVVTEKAGTMRIVAADGSVSAPLSGVPAVDDEVQGGLLDIVASPAFGTDSTVFFCYSEPAAGGQRISVARAVLGPQGLSNVAVIFRQETVRRGGLHNGARLAFAPDGNLFVSLGERNDRALAQNLASTAGKVIRIAPDGSIPADNPFVGTPGAAPAVFSYGHRSPQGATIDPRTGQLWVSEHGPQGGDEINLVTAGSNYGWANISYGREYDSGAPVGTGTTAAGVVPPVVYWTPVSMAPSNMVFYTGDKVPALTGQLLMAGLRAQALMTFTLAGNAITAEARYATPSSERIRDVRQGFDGYPYVITDTGRLLRVAAR